MSKIIGLFSFVACFLFSIGSFSAENTNVIEQNVVLNVASVEIVSDYAPASSDNMDMTLYPTPSERIKDWISNHFFATSQGTDTVKFIITNASVLEEYIPSKGFSFTSHYKYSAMFSVRAIIVDEQGNTVRSFISKVWGTKTISDSSSIEEREESLSKMTDTLVASLAEQLSKGVQNNFQKYIDKNILN